MEGLFEPYQKSDRPGAAHNGQIKALARSRADKLLSLGEDEAAIRKTMDNAHRLDRYATTGTALVGGVPFSGMVALQFAKPGVISGATQYLFGEIENAVAKAAAEGGVGGMEAHYPDEFFQRLFKEAKQDSFFLKPPAEKLHGALTDSLTQKQPGKLQEAMEDALQIQTYLARAFATNLTAAVLTATNKAAHVETFNKFAVPLGNYLSGLGTAHLKHKAQNGRHERGEALLFGLRDAEPKANFDEEEDWLNVYMAAKNGSLLSAMGHGGERMGNMLLGALGNSLDALGKALTSANSLGGGYVGLGLTFAARAAAQQAATALVSGAWQKAAVGGAVNFVGTGAAFGMWAFIASLSSKLSDEGKAWVNADNHAAPKAALGIRAAQQLQTETDGGNLRQRTHRLRNLRGDLEAQVGDNALALSTLGRASSADTSGRA
ncbi:hypothetical protein [Pseudomonas typographi]|uniref:Uncharacterized protein n=1 Tax=Pseudomonas typographi TaxID=2715964 RepID=A0ABR7Z581_9PSED|nr:hypothetical protein [Pseudomonas typographi]MBD1552825.1 hypothetical protein [Pseudomonas typographi]MBD1586929.1 hypothetical protein [Pseudomonas typographi]MBD1600612.1 hypothetical protein [Pseudomonas typographi]